MRCLGVLFGAGVSWRAEAISKNRKNENRPKRIPRRKGNQFKTATYRWRTANDETHRVSHMETQIDSFQNQKLNPIQWEPGKIQETSRIIGPKPVVDGTQMHMFFFLFNFSSINALQVVPSLEPLVRRAVAFYSHEKVRKNRCTNLKIKFGPYEMRFELNQIEMGDWWNLLGSIDLLVQSK